MGFVSHGICLFVGLIAGALIYRNNAKRVEDDLAEATQEIEALRRRLAGFGVYPE